MTKISAVIITKNEQNNIRRCLESIQNIVDEIVIVDAFSEDDTLNICQQYKVHFVQKKFIDFSDAKNFGISLATNPYILSIDADEELSPELKSTILQIKPTLDNIAYCFNRRTNYCGQWIRFCGWYPDTKLRLFNKSKAQWQGSIHETLIFNNEVPVKKIHGDLLHYSYTNFYSHVEKLNFYSELQAQNLFEKQKKVSLLKIIFSPIYEFLSTYLLRLGFLEGYNGFVISVMAAHSKLYKFIKLRNLWRHSKKNAVGKA